MNFPNGNFKIGCNYWASHAGTAMWSDWRPEVVISDFKMMAEAGMQIVRVFPLWPDFQPLRMHMTFQSHQREMRQGEAVMEDISGVSSEALKKFRFLADAAEENGISLVVGLVTGWMSARLFVPEALAGRNIFSDPTCLKWQIRYVRRFVREFKGHKAIALWELGNESNCMDKAASRDEAWSWTNAIASAIRLEDSSIPVASGMHGIYPQADASFDTWGVRGCWSIEDQGELTDVMTSHPYPHSPSKRAARIDQVGSMRSVFQAVVETRLYGDIAGRPAFIEELGTLHPMVCDEATQAEFVRNVVLNGIAHDCGALLWWCAFEQIDLESTPYAWTSWERELGLFRSDFSKKPVCEELGKLRKRIASLPVKEMPKFRRDAICLLTPGSGNDALLGIAWSCFVLAKQAGFDIEFQYEGDTLKDSQLYIVPSIKGAEALSRKTLLELERRIENGATVYVSLDDGSLAPFNRIFGLRCANREERSELASFKFEDADFNCKAQFKLALKPEGADVLACEPDGTPVLTRYRKGKGEAWLMTLPIEDALASQPKAFEAEAKSYWKIYEAFAGKAIAGRLARRDNPQVSATEHPLDESHAIIMLVNNSGQAQSCRVELAQGWKAKGAGIADLELPPHDGLAIEIFRQES